MVGGECSQTNADPQLLWFEKDKYFGDNMSCKFDKECAYTHRDNVNMKEINELTEELKNIIAELNVLKNTIKFLPEIEKEGKFM